MGYRSIHEIKEANRRAGEFFFSPGTMHFFASKVLPTVYGGRYFITSERFGSTAQRVYSVRECDELGFITSMISIRGKGMVIYKVSRTIRYTEYYLLEVENEERIEDGTVSDLISMDGLSPYFVESEKNDGETDWTECTEKEARAIEQEQFVQREHI